MKRTLALLLCAFVAGFAVDRAAGQARPPQATPRMWADVVLDVATEEIPRRTRVHVNVDHWEPGAETGRHTHPGPVVFVMLEGELEETLADGRTRRLEPGQAFWKPPRTEHNVRNRSDRPARAVAVHLDPR
jgi:quercetin dioxygenase-like cupin family protein